MTDELQQNVEKKQHKPRPTVFKAGYDPRRWLGGRGKKSPEQKKGEEILLTVIWEELSREFDADKMRPLEQPETVDALRLMVRGWIKKRPNEIADRIAGKVTDKMDVTSGGDKIANPYAAMTDAELKEFMEKLLHANPPAA